MPRIRNWKGLTYFQHAPEARYRHIDALFEGSTGGRNVIDWKLIEKMWPDLRSVRTVALRRYLADPALRRRVTAVMNKVEAYNGFAAWLRFGNGGVIAENDPAEQEKMIKFNSLLANCVIFHTALNMTEVIRRLITEGWEISAEDIAQLSPYITEHITRFGVYATDVLRLRPQAFDPELADVDFDALAEAAKRNRPQIDLLTHSPIIGVVVRHD
jgi:hypothetical protein